MNSSTLEPRTASDQAAPESARRRSSHPAKGCRERTGSAESKGHADFSYRVFVLGEKNLRAFDPASHMIAVRWHPDRLLEGPAKVKLAKAYHAGQRCKRDRLG